MEQPNFECEFNSELTLGLINISPAHDVIIIQPNLSENLILSFDL
mgnify:CR=1 FL=1